MLERSSLRVAIGCSLLILTTAVFAADRNRRLDPPGFGVVTLKPGQTVRLNVTCFEHRVGLVPPGPCRGTAMFHDSTDQVLLEQTVDLKPGESRSVQFTLPLVIGDVILPPVAIDPCWLPDPGGRSIPSVEVFDAAGRLLHYENVASPRMSQFNNTFTNPAVISGFNPQPDPPAFGLITLARGQTLRMNVACFAHPVNGTPPDPCRGTVMFHDAAGNVLSQSEYALRPGQVAGVTLDPQPESDIIPCFLPANGGRAVPNVELVDVASGDTLFLINPAAARASQFQ